MEGKSRSWFDGRYKICKRNLTGYCHCNSTGSLVGTYMDAFDPGNSKMPAARQCNKLATAGYHGGNRRKNQFILCDNIACQYIQQLRCDQYPWNRSGFTSVWSGKTLFYRQINFAASTSGQVIPIAARDLKIFKNISSTGSVWARQFYRFRVTTGASPLGPIRCWP